MGFKGGLRGSRGNVVRCCRDEGRVIGGEVLGGVEEVKRGEGVE